MVADDRQRKNDLGEEGLLQEEIYSNRREHLAKLILSLSSVELIELLRDAGGLLAQQ